MKQKHGMGVGILGMGAYFPDDVRTNDWWPKEWVEEHLKGYATDVVAVVEKAARETPQQVDPEIVRHAARYASDPFRGARTRHTMGESENSSDMEVHAGRKALAAACVTPSDVDLLITFSQVPDYPCPGNHALVAHKLGLRETCTSMTVGADCASFVHHLATASLLVRSGQYRCALTIQSNAASRVMDWTRPASLNVGDGAVAQVVGPVPDGFGFIDSYLGTSGEFHAAVRIAPGSPAGHPWYRGDLHQSPLVFQSMDHEGSAKSTSAAVTMARVACERVLHQAGYRFKDVAWFATSQPTAWFAEACAETLGLSANATLSTFSEKAHLMPASAPYNLLTALQREHVQPGDLVLIYSPGAGLVQGAALIRWADGVRS